MTPNRASLDKLLLEQGVSLVPIVRGTKKPPAGFPLLEHFNGCELTLDELASTWSKYDRAAVCGIGALCVFDFDSSESYQKFWDHKLAVGIQNETLTVKTSRGFQNWFFDSSINLGETKSSIDARPILEAEILVQRHLAQCPGNLHPSGITYELLGTGRIAKRDGALQAALERLRSLGWSGSPYPAPVGSSTLASHLNKEVSEEEISRIVKSLLPLWRPGYRNRLTLALSGFLIKEGVSQQSALLIFERLIEAAGDKGARYSVLGKVRYQYHTKDKHPLSGLSTIVQIRKELGLYD